VLRHGVDPHGRRLFVMANVNSRYLSNEDMQAVIAYLRSQPAMGNETPDPPDRYNLLAMIVLGTKRNWVTRSLTSCRDNTRYIDLTGSVCVRSGAPLHR
jgi:hypothetical protein